jgi:hypothetical protein
MSTLSTRCAVFPENQSAPVPVLPAICAWCPTFDRAALSNRGASHTICPRCLAEQLAIVGGVR